MVAVMQSQVLMSLKMRITRVSKLLPLEYVHQNRVANRLIHSTSDAPVPKSLVTDLSDMEGK